MHRRDFLRSTGGAAALATGIATGTAIAATPAIAAAPALARAPRRLTLALPWPANVAGYADDGLRLARRIEAACDGDLLIEIRHGDVDRADLMFGPAQARVALHPAFAYFAGLPGDTAFAAAELDGWLMAGGGQELWDRLAAPHGFKPLLAGHTGPEPVLWSRTPIRTPEDVAGTRIWVRGLAADVVRGLGGLAVAPDDTRAEDMPATGDVDAMEWGSLVHASAIGLPSRLPFGLAGAFGGAGSALSLDVDLAVWERMSPARQMAVAAAASAEFRAGVADIRATQAAVEDAVRARFGATIARPSLDFRAAVGRIAAAVVAHAAAFDAEAALVDTSHAAYRRHAAAGPMA